METEQEDLQMHVLLYAEQQSSHEGHFQGFGRHEVFPRHLVAAKPRGLFHVSQSPLSPKVAVKLPRKDRFRGHQAETPAVR